MAKDNTMIPIPGPSGVIMQLSPEQIGLLAQGDVEGVVKLLVPYLPIWVHQKTLHKLIGLHPKDAVWGIGQGIFEESNHFKQIKGRRLWHLKRMIQAYPTFRKRLILDRY